MSDQYDSDLHALGLGPDAKPGEVGPAYLTKAREFARIILEGDAITVSMAIEMLHKLHEAYPKALEASEMQVQLSVNYQVLMSQDSAKEEKILAGIRFVSGADGRHLKQLESILLNDGLPEKLRRDAGVKIHSMEDRSGDTHRGPIIMIQYAPSLDLSSYSNLSPETVNMLATAPFIPEEIRDFAGSRVLVRQLVRWNNRVIANNLVQEVLRSISKDEAYTPKTRAAAEGLARMVRSLVISGEEPYRTRMKVPAQAAPDVAPSAPKMPRRS